MDARFLQAVYDWKPFPTERPADTDEGDYFSLSTPGDMLAPRCVGKWDGKQFVSPVDDTTPIEGVTYFANLPATPEDQEKGL